MPSNHLILCHPLLLPPSIFPSIKVFSNESALCIRWPKYWSFSFSISPSNEYSELIFRMDWLDLLALQGTLKSLLQHHSSKASILQCSAFFIVQLSYPYITAGKTIALTRRTFVDKVISTLLFNMPMAPHSSTLAWKIPWTEEPGRRQSVGSHRVRHDWATSLSLFTFMHWRRKWWPTPVLLPGKSHGQKSLVGDSPWGCKEWDTTEHSTATAAKSLQSCLTLCDPIDGSPPGFPVPGILQARTLEWVAISFSNAWKWKVKVQSLSRVRLLATPWTAAYQAPPSLGFSRQEYWSGVPLPSPQHSNMHKVNKLQKYIVQHREYSHYFIITALFFKLIYF